MDASDHEWIKGIKCHLHAAIDDSTGMIVGAYFDVQETLNGFTMLQLKYLKNMEYLICFTQIIEQFLNTGEKARKV